MADHDAAVPERDESIGKLSMTTTDGERDSTALPHHEPAPEQAPEDDTNQTESEPTSEDNQVDEDAAAVEQASVESTSIVEDVAVAEDASIVEATAAVEDVTIDEPAVEDDDITTAAQEHAAVRSSDSDIDIDDLEEVSTDVAASSTSTTTDTESIPESITESSTTTTTTTTVTTVATKSTTTEEIDVDSTSTTATASATVSAEEATEEPAEDAHETVGRRMTYIGEGLLDIGGMDAIDRLSDVTSYADLVGRSEVSAPPPPHLAINRLQAFLSMGSRQKPAAAAILSPAVAAPAPVAVPAPVTVSSPSRPPQAPAPAAVKTVAIENRKSKLLDFLANDVGERYLDGVYQDETRDAPDASSDEGDAHDDATSTRVQKTDAELQQDRQRREQRANSKLLAFLAKERGERLHRVERSRSSEDAQRLPLSSDTAPSSDRKPASQQLLSQSQGPAKTPSKLLEFVAKAVTDKPKLVIFNPEDAVSETDELEHLVAEEALKKKQKREEREKARQKVMAFLAEETAPSSSASASASAAKAAGSTVKSVDETKVQREKVVDRYGREGLLDFLDRTESAQQQRIKWATARSSSHGSSSPASSGSRSPKSPSQLTSPSMTSATASTTTRQELTAMPSPPPKTSAPAKSLMRTPSSNSTGNRLASFLSKITSKHSLAVSSSSSSSSSGSSSSGSFTSSPVKTKKTSDMPPRHSSQPRAAPVAATAPVTSDATVPPAPSTPEPRSTRGSANKMAPVLSALEQITQTCAANELSDVSIARISTLLTSISQIVKDDVARGGKPPVRRWSDASSTGAAASPSGAASPSWVKSGKEIEEFDKKHALVKSASAPVKPDSSAPAVLERDSELKVTVASSVLESFSEFETAQNLLEVVAAFHQLLTDCGLTDLKLEQPWAVYDHVKAAVASKLGFRQKQLFKLLDTKLTGDVYCTKPAARKRVCIIGAGPVGLRAAVEMALLGAQVVVLEKRKHFSRENILHLWPWVVQDLTSLGAKVLFPQFCHSTAYFHVGTRQLQCILLKVALLLGVTFFPATAFEGIAHPDSVDSDRRPFYTIVTKPQIPWMEFTAVLSASGTQDRLSEQARIKRFVFSRKEAIGLVCYFPNHNTTEEKDVTEFSWTIQFKQQMFAKMREVGVDLENIVYYRGEMHYLVMTPKRQNLLDQGVMKHDYPNVSDLVQDSNIDKHVLHSYLKRVVDFVKIPQKADFARVRIFDFSARTRADKAASILTSKGKKLYVGLIGDSLMEPFWPEGLGTCRGFLSALDGCWMLARIGFSSDEQLLADRELAYRVVQHVSGFRRDDLQKNVRKYSVDPTTRYNVKFPQLC